MYISCNYINKITLIYKSQRENKKKYLYGSIRNVREVFWGLLSVDKIRGCLLWLLQVGDSGSGDRVDGVFERRGAGGGFRSSPRE